MALYLSITSRARVATGEPALPPVGKLRVGDIAEARRLTVLLGSKETRTGELAALSLLDDIYHTILGRHLQERDATLIDRLLATLRAQLGLELLDRLLVEFAEEFLGGKIEGLSLSIDGASGEDAKGPSRQAILREVIVFWLLHTNPAARPLVVRLHDAPLLGVREFERLTALIVGTLDREPSYGGEANTLWSFLTLPHRHSPDSLAGQLEYVRRHWQVYVGEIFELLEKVRGVLAEEAAPRLPPGPGPSEIPSYEGLEEARYSMDRSWMTRLVLIAKHTLVWLHQLSAIQGRTIHRLDQIPDEALEALAREGFSGLWLIGIWERSAASRKIKQLCGNPEAIGSAYSLDSYRVAEALGGEPALEDLQRRAGDCGLRLAVDMVPNHIGVDSPWVLEKPDWFVGQRDSPFPAYRFEGPDLSPRSDIGLYLEDHYYDRSDAAVVFKRVDRKTNETRFIYHGNDGTSTPWNDTAQLDYLKPEVREKILETILEVARRVPIIRFDAAMTLTRRHFQRLWYPTSETAGAIPSRAEHGMSEERFQALMPRELWREVVDRVAAEAPDTLLLAEAFWLMEGYFVRFLGMHRVYNSAFMNMLRDGETGRYRQLIKETLEFDPEILKRYVNFMSNPDERSAVDQFGKGDRYFGTCMVMSTLPGTPMFGHGQLEGFAEKYGMEYRRAYWSETADGALVERHRREIAPLLRRRQVFADVAHFRLYDLLSFGNEVNERVLAYSNGGSGEAVLCLFNNSALPAHGRLRHSAPFRRGRTPEEGSLVSESIGDALGTSPEGGFWSCRDSCSGREFLVHGGEISESGLEVDLGPYEYRVMTDFRPLDLEPAFGLRMKERVSLRGAASLEAVRRRTELEPLHEALSAALDRELLRSLSTIADEGSQAGPEDDDLLERSGAAAEDFLRRASDSAGGTGSLPDGVTDRERFLALITLPELASRLAAFRVRAHREVGKGLLAVLRARPEVLTALYCWAVIEAARAAAGSAAVDSDAVSAWDLESTLIAGLVAAGGQPEPVGRLVSALGLGHRLGWGIRPTTSPDAGELLQELITNDEARRLLQVHQFEGNEYMSREAVELLLDWRLALESVVWNLHLREATDVPRELSAWWQSLSRLKREAATASYRIESLTEFLVEND